MPSSDLTNISFLIFPGFPMACLTSMIEPLRAANEIAGTRTFDWQLMSETGAAVTSSARVVFEPDAALQDMVMSEILILLSGPQGQFSNPSRSNAALRRFDRAGVILGGISGGVFPLVKAGVMEGHRCSVHWCYEAAFKSEFPTILATDDVIVMDRRRYTASGAAAAFDLALRLIEERLDAGIAHEVACWFQHPTMRGEGIRQRVPMKTTPDPALPTLVARAVDLFVGRMDDPISIGDVADQLGVTPRQIERAFKKATGQSPSHYYRSIRMAAARQLVLYSKDSVGQIASAVGYMTSTPLVAHYRKAFGVTPQEDRDRMNAFRVEGNTPLPSI
ncbi:MAG: GlxA family transcriptional regulator [Pseudomonadota bacterium]